MQPHDQSGVKLPYDQICEMVSRAGFDGMAIDLGRVKASQVGVAGLVALVRQATVDNGPRLKVKHIHERHHFGVDRTLDLEREWLGQRASHQLVKVVVLVC